MAADFAYLYAALGVTFFVSVLLTLLVTWMASR